LTQINKKITFSDKKCVLYRAEDGAKIAEFEGHKKGIWSCAFSPVDQVIATGSADGDIRIWHLKEQTCIKALEGQLVDHLSHFLTIF